MTEKQKYYALQSLVCETLPTSAIDALSKKDYPMPSTALIQVRIGRTINLPALVALVRAGLPQFEIPEHLLPAMPAVAESALAGQLSL
jgi:hypothetical protein